MTRGVGKNPKCKKKTHFIKPKRADDAGKTTYRKLSGGTRKNMEDTALTGNSTVTT